MLGQRVTLWRESFTGAAQKVKNRDEIEQSDDIEAVNALAK